LFCKLLDIRPRDNDGETKRVFKMLKENESQEDSDSDEDDSDEDGGGGHYPSSTTIIISLLSFLYLRHVTNY